MEKNDFVQLTQLDEYTREKVPGVYVIFHALWPKNEDMDPDKSIWEGVCLGVMPSFFEKVLLPHYLAVATEHERRLEISRLSGFEPQKEGDTSPKKDAHVHQVRFIKANVKEPYEKVTYKDKWEYGYEDFVSFMDGGEIRQIMDTFFRRSVSLEPEFPLSPEREKEIFRENIPQETTEE